MTPGQEKMGRDRDVALVRVLIGRVGVWEALETVAEAIASESSVGAGHPLVYDLRWLRNKHEFRSKR